jgi:flagellar basal-body rod protein FlgB
MDLGTLPLFKAMTQRMSWLGERQKTLAQNVANADTPKYLAQDLKPLSFGELMGSAAKLQMTATQPNHLAGGAGAARFAPAVDKSAPVSPSGNSVSLEEQMLKVSGTATDYQLTTELYRQHLTMLRTVLGKG